MKKFTAAVSMLAMLAAVTLAFGTGPASAQDDKPDIAITAVDLANQTVTIHNNGDAEFDPNGIWLCNFPSYAAISGAPVIAPGESITIDSAGTGVNFDADGGEMGLYTTNDFESSDGMVSYVEWGDSGHERAGVAAAAGVWDEVAVDAAGESVITATTTAPSASTDWVAGAGTDDAAEAEAAQTDDLPATGADTWPLLAIAVVMMGAGLLLINGRRQLTRSH